MKMVEKAGQYQILPGTNFNAEVFLITYFFKYDYKEFINYELKTSK